MATHVNKDILNFMKENLDATFEDVRKAFPDYADKTISSQRSRSLNVIKTGQPNRPRKKDSKKKVTHDHNAGKHFQKSLDALSKVPRTQFVPQDEAAEQANGQKRHVNLHNAVDEKNIVASRGAEDWLTWMRCAESAPKDSIEVDFEVWLLQSDKNMDYRTNKLKTRWEKFEATYLKLAALVKKAI